jgi:hypothetical protein
MKLRKLRVFTTDIKCSLLYSAGAPSEELYNWSNIDNKRVYPKVSGLAA